MKAKGKKNKTTIILNTIILKILIYNLILG